MKEVNVANLGDDIPLIMDKTRITEETTPMRDFKRRKTEEKQIVVALDLDGTLCTIIPDDEVAEYSTTHSECVIIKALGFNHVFRPYISNFIKYLLHKRFRIVFFSAGAKVRNDELIKLLLIHTLGCAELEAKLAEGQFETALGHSLFAHSQNRKNKCEFSLV